MGQWDGHRIQDGIHEEEPSFPNPQIATGKNLGHNRQHREASLFHDSDLARFNISTPWHSPPAHPISLKYIYIRSFFSTLSSAFPPSFNSVLRLRGKEGKSSFLASPQVTATRTDLSCGSSIPQIQSASYPLPHVPKPTGPRATGAGL